MRPDFERCAHTAVELLLAQEIRSFRLRVPELKLDKNIRFDTFEHYASLTGVPPDHFCRVLDDGCTVLYGGQYLILFPSQPLSPRLNYTLAHEVGHVYLDHKTDRAKEEIEANFFAAELLMPEMVIRALAQQKGRIDAYDLCFLFGVSYEAAQKRIGTLNRKACPFGDPLHQQLLQKYQPLLNDYVQYDQNLSAI